MVTPAQKIIPICCYSHKINQEGENQIEDERNLAKHHEDTSIITQSRFTNKQTSLPLLPLDGGTRCSSVESALDMWDMKIFSQYQFEGNFRH